MNALKTGLNIVSRSSRLFVHGLVILNFGLGLGYIVAWLIAWRQGMFWRADFSAFYTGWAIVRDGLGERLFDFALQARYQAAILQGRSFKDGLLPFINPPGMVLLLTPLARLPLSLAFGLWSLGMVGLFAWLLRLLWQFSAGWQPFERWMLIAMVVAFPPLFTTFMLGAFSLLMLVVFFQFYLALKRQHTGWLAFWLTLGAIKPQLVLVPGVMLASARRWRALAWAILAGIGMVLISSALLGWRIWLDYAEQLRAVGNFFGKYGIDPAGMYNFRGVLTTLLGAERLALINSLSALALVGSLLVVFLIWRRPASSILPDFELRVAFALGLGLFFNLHLYPQDGLLYLIPLALFYDYLRRRDQAHNSHFEQKAFVFFALLLPIFFLYSEFNLGARLGVRGPVFAALVLLVWIGKALWVDRRLASSELQ